MIARLGIHVIAIFALLSQIAVAQVGGGSQTQLMGANYRSNTVGAPVSSGVTVNMAIITLGSGGWDCWANVTTVPAATTTTSNAVASLSTSNAISVQPMSYYTTGASQAAGVAETLALPAQHFVVASGTTMNIYLDTVVTFTVSTMALNGAVECRLNQPQG